MLGAGESKEPVPLASVLERRRAQPERHEDAGGSRPQKGVSGHPRAASPGPRARGGRL